MKLPRDPLDDRIQKFGNPDLEHDMVNKLPENARAHGIALDRTAPRQKYFVILYVDAADAWHELKMPILMGFAC